MVPQDVIYDDTRAGRQSRRRVDRPDADARRPGHRLLDLVRLLRLRLPPHHLASASSRARFAIDRKIRVAIDEAHADVMIGHDTGCITTLDKNQWIGKAAGKAVDLPVLADCQFAALVCGAHPYKIVQSHWHASSTETLMEKLGIDWQAKKAEFVAYLEEVKAGKPGKSLRPAPHDHLGPRLHPDREPAVSTTHPRRRRRGPRGSPPRMRSPPSASARSSSRRSRASAARRSCPATRSSCLPANGRRMRSAAW